MSLEQELLKKLPADQARKIVQEAIMPPNRDLPDHGMLPAIWEDQRREILAWAREVRAGASDETRV